MRRRSWTSPSGPEYGPQSRSSTATRKRRDAPGSFSRTARSAPSARRRSPSRCGAPTPTTPRPDAGPGTATAAGVLITQAIHTLDLYLSLAGPARSVVAAASTSRGRLEAEDTSHLLIDQGTLAASVTASTAAWPGGAETIHLYGDAGQLRLRGIRSTRSATGSPGRRRDRRRVRTGPAVDDGVVPVAVRGRLQQLGGRRGTPVRCPVRAARAIGDRRRLQVRRGRLDAGRHLGGKGKRMSVLSIRVDGPNDYRLDHGDAAAPGEGEVLVALDSAGICGGDLSHLRGRNAVAAYPTVLGHECAGRVSRVGPGTSLAVGHR